MNVIFWQSVAIGFLMVYVSQGISRKKSTLFAESDLYESHVGNNVTGVVMWIAVRFPIKARILVFIKARLGFY